MTTFFPVQRRSSVLHAPPPVLLRKHRSGSFSIPALVMLLSLVVIGALLASIFGRSASSRFSANENSIQPLVIFCAASNKGVLEAIRKDYEAECGVPLQIQYGGSQTLLASIELTKSGDLYLPADNSYLQLARSKNLIAQEFPLATMHALVVVPKGNPKRISKLSDLSQPGVRLAQGSPDATAIGKLTKDRLSRAGNWDALAANTTVYKTTVNDVANDVKVGAVDAGIAFDVVLHDYDSLEGVHLPELDVVKANISAAVLRCSSQQQRALEFARYLSSHDYGLAKYREFGFKSAVGGQLLPSGDAE